MEGGCGVSSHEMMRAGILALDGVLRAYGYPGPEFPQNVPMCAGEINKWISMRCGRDVYLIGNRDVVMPQRVGAHVGRLIAILDAPARPA
jgi:hypothetical protein